MWQTTVLKGKGQIVCLLHNESTASFYPWHLKINCRLCEYWGYQQIMNSIKNAYRSLKDFCNRVVQWRSACTVPYILAINTAFFSIAYYENTETQMKSLAALSFIIFFNDVLFTPTNNNLFLQIVMWPIRDLWKTCAVILCGFGIHQLGEGNKDEALWCSFTAG